MTQISDVRSGGSYLSQSDLRVHFGLAATTKIDSVEIRWARDGSGTTPSALPNPCNPTP